MAIVTILQMTFISLEKLRKVLIGVFFFLQTFVHNLLSLEIFTLGKKTTLHC